MTHIAEPIVKRHFEHRGFGPEFSMELDWIARRIPHDANPIVEIGCGIGALFDTLGHDRLIGVDHAQSGIRRTAQRYPHVRLVCASAESLPFADRFADAIVAQHVVEHISPYLRACREWFRVLRPGGILIILTPNHSFADLSLFADPTHVALFNNVSLGQVLGSAGFVTAELRTLGLPAFRKHTHLPGLWRLRRLMTTRAVTLSRIPGWRWRGQTLCCLARRPRNS